VRVLALAAAGTLAVVAVVALTAALVAGYVAATRYAVATADAARSAGLAREAFAVLSPETSAGVDAFDEVSAATGLTDDRLVALTKSLRAAKVSAAQMPKALMAAANAEAALGSGGADEFIGKIREATLTVDDFARTSEAKFGGIVQAQLRGLDAQGARFNRAWSKLFDGLEIEPVLDALGVLVGMFEKGNPLAEAFGGALRGAFEPVSEHALSAAYAVEAFALGFAIQLTKMYLAVRPVLRWVTDLFGFEDQTLLDTMRSAGEIAAKAAAIFGGLLFGALALVGGTWPASAPPSTSAAPATFRFPPHSSLRSTPPTAARPASICPRARTTPASTSSRQR
jgi:hypothetical protein